MKKIMSVLVVLMFAFSMIPFAMAESEETGNDEPVAVTATPLKDAAKSIIDDVDDVDGCIEKMKKDYPRMDRIRIEDVCKTLIKAKEEAQVREEIQSQMRERIAEDEIAQGERLREEIKERMQIRNEALRERIEIKLKNQLGESQRYKMQRFLEEHPELEDKIQNLSDEEISKLALFDREKIREISKEKDIKEKLNDYEVKKVKKEDLYKNREISKESFEQSKEKYEKAKERYDESKEKFLEAKERFENAVKAGNETQAIENAKEYLGNGIEMIISSLEKVKENANSNDDLTEEEVEDIVSNADAKIAQMESLKEKLEAAQTKEEIKNIAQEMNQEWARIRLHVAYGAAKAFDSKVGEILSRSNQLQAKLERTLLRLEEKGYNVSAVDEMVDEFNAKVSSAEENYNSGKEILVQIKDIRVQGNLTKEEFDSMMDDAKEKIRKAHEDLKEAQIILKNIVKEAKGLDPSISFEDEESETEILEEVSDEVETEEEEEEESETENEEDREVETEQEDEEEVETEEETEQETETEETLETNETVSETEEETEDLNNSTVEQQ